jgi:hypothetical protein
MVETSSAFCGIWRFTTMFVKTVTGPYQKQLQMYMLHFSKIHVCIILPPRWSPIWLCSSCFSTITLYAFLLAHIRATCLAHPRSHSCYMPRPSILLRVDRLGNREAYHFTISFQSRLTAAFYGSNSLTILSRLHGEIISPDLREEAARHQDGIWVCYRAASTTVVITSGTVTRLF